ncbi:MAG: hypothetical protein KUG50_04350, partial [Cycloclasticus sp.]|nr:hypothetical protein [Cycloclasticus sp.]
MRLSLISLLTILAFSTPLSLAAPSLPTGLSKPTVTKPTLPKGLFETPSLPIGIESTEDKKRMSNSLPPFKSDSLFNFNGFLDFRSGIRTQTDPNESQQSLNETRLQLASQTEISSMLINLTGDLLADTV